MSTVQRFNYIGDDAEMVEESDGAYVLFSDLDKAVSDERERAAKIVEAQVNKPGPCVADDIFDLAATIRNDSEGD